MDAYTQSEIEKAVDVIKSANSFLLSCHVHPDGDALGSTLAMAHALIMADKDVIATFPDPFVIPENLEKSLPGIEILKSRSYVIENRKSFDVMMTFDCGSKTRLVGLEELIDSSAMLINVDHHVSNEKFGDINIIDSAAASSGSVVLSLLDACSIELNREAAQCMYVALLTDTGRFQFSSTNEQVFEQAKRLSRFDLPITDLSRWLTEEDPYNFLKLAGKALSEMERDEKSNLVSAVATKKMQEDFCVSYEQIEGLIELIRRTKESDVACVIKEYSSGEYRVSLRSLGAIDVCVIASNYGGGGHKFAAGFTSHLSPKEIISNVREEIIKQRKK